MTLPELHCDVETRATVDLKKSGVYVYAADPQTDVWCMSYRFSNIGPIKRWRMGQPCPADIAEHVKNNGSIVAFNAAFERIIWWAILSGRYGWPKPAIEQFRCVMVACMAMSLPASLENAAPALGISEGKDMPGHRLMLQMSKPRKVASDGMVTWWDDAERLEKLYSYCDRDVDTETQVDQRVVPLRPSEQKLWWLDQKINDRGVKVDTVLCRQSAKVVAAATEKLDNEMRSVTLGEVSGCNNVMQLMIWLRSKGVETQSVDKEHLEELLGLPNLPPDAEAALNLRKEAAKASTAKINALLNCVNTDQRARGLLQFHAANTGRWGGRRFQPQNLPRPTADNPEDAIPALMTGDARIVEAIYDRPLNVVSDCLRSMLVAAPGKVIAAADFAQIEARVLAWLASEIWLIKLFRENGPLYEQMASDIFRRPITKADKKERQVGKWAILGAGFGMGAPKFQATCKKSGVIIDETLAQRSIAAYRDKNTKIKSLWYAAEDAAIDAVLHPGKVTSCAGGKIKYRVAGSFLWCQLPSGRCLCYPYPRIVDVIKPWGETGPELRYKCVNSYTRKWEEGGTYGGSLVENFVQAVARDLLAEAMLRSDEQYPLVLTVHDELVAEVDAGSASVDEYEKLMATLPSWALGCPVAAEGWVGARYRK